MTELNEIESKYFDLIESKISIKEFENWVYKSKWLEVELSEEEYLDLISLNYGTPSSRYEIGKILNGRLDKGKFETIRMIELLNSVIQKDGKEGESLMKMYDLYCKGYYFLDDLGLGIGLFKEVPHKYGIDYFYELNKEQKKELIDSVYPSVKELAKELKNWLIIGDLKLTGEQESELNRWQYEDNRTEEEKKSRIWRVEDIDVKTGEIRSKRNILLNKDGSFKSTEKLNDNWVSRIFNRNKPNH